MKERYDQFFEKIKNSKILPSPPQILLKLTDLCHREEGGVEDLAWMVGKDVALSAKVMETAAASGFDPSGKAIDIEAAVNRLGRGGVKNIVNSASVAQAFSHVGDRLILDLQVFWKHSLTCAAISKQIARKIDYNAPEEAFLAGLLHDVGRLVLWANFPDEYAGVLSFPKNPWNLTMSGEARYGAAHSEVGARLIRGWNLRSFVADAVFYHHESADRIQNALPLVKIVYVANILCPETNYDGDFKSRLARDIFGFEADQIDGIVSAAHTFVDDTAEVLEMDAGRTGAPPNAVCDAYRRKQKELVGTVAQTIQLQGALQHLEEAEEQNEIIEAVERGVRDLIDVRPVLFFVLDPGKNLLVGRSPASGGRFELVDNVSIPFEEENSLLVKSILQRKPLDSYDASIKNHLTIIDEQLIRLSGKDGILCLPMTARQQPVGGMVMGLDEDRLSALTEKKNLVMLYARKAAAAFLPRSQDPVAARDAETPSAETLSIKARKMVHDANTPLSIIKNYLAVLRRRLPEDGSFHNEIKIINEELDSVAALIREMGDAYRPDSRISSSVNLNALLASLVGTLRESKILRPEINVDFSPDASLPGVAGDKNKVKQIFNNLVMNAAEAMPDGGNLSVSTRYVSGGFDSREHPQADRARGYAEITIRDDGPGIEETIKARLFEPYVTSKGAGHSGLGLSIVSSNVKDLSGSITCDSSPETGTSFKVVLPVLPNGRAITG